MTRARDRSSGDIFIRRATLSDVPMIADLHGQLFEQAWSPTFMTDLIGDPNCHGLIALDRIREQGVGFTIVRVAVDEAEVLSLGVAEPYQRLGIGRRLVTSLLMEMRKVFVTSVFLEVAEDNAPACALYARHGFQQTGRRSNYYRRMGGDSRDALTLAVAPTSNTP